MTETKTLAELGREADVLEKELIWYRHRGDFTKTLTEQEYKTKSHQLRGELWVLEADVLRERRELKRQFQDLHDLLVSKADEGLVTVQIGDDKFEFDSHERFCVIITLKWVLAVLGKETNK